MLPGLINHLTPEGQAPAQGLGNGEDLMGMLGMPASAAALIAGTAPGGAAFLEAGVQPGFERVKHRRRIGLIENLVVKALETARGHRAGRDGR
jgi:hypothetical protein